LTFLGMKFKGCFQGNIIFVAQLGFDILDGPVSIFDVMLQIRLNQTHYQLDCLENGAFSAGVTTDQHC